LGTKGLSTRLVNKMKQITFLISILMLAANIFAKEVDFGKWQPSDNTISVIDKESKFNGFPVLKISSKNGKDSFFVKREKYLLPSNSAYVFGFYFMPDDLFIKNKGRIFIILKCGATKLNATWYGQLIPDKWHYLNVRLDVASAEKAQITILAQRKGSLLIAKPILTKISPPKTGINLSGQYLQIPFGIQLENKIHDNLNLDEGTIEFWVRPHWKEKSNRHFEYKNMRGFFFWGEDNRYNSISLFSWNKFPNLYFSYAGDNRKKFSCLFRQNSPDKGWKTNWWHHLAATWEKNSGKAVFSFFIDGMPAPATTTFVNTKISDFIKRDMFLGICKHHNTLMFSQIANSDFAMFRVSKNTRYSKPFIPNASYGSDKNTLCFFPLSSSKDLEGLFPCKKAKTKKLKAELVKIDYNKK
jgi:hypothetical protein